MLKVHALGHPEFLTKAKDLLEEILGPFVIVDSSLSPSKVNPNADILLIVTDDVFKVLDVLAAMTHGKPVYIVNVEYYKTDEPNDKLKNESDYYYHTLGLIEQYHYFKIKGLVKVSTVDP